MPINNKKTGPVSSDNTTDFITGQTNTPYDWITPQNTSLWASNTPCPNGWKIPSKSNYEELGSGRSDTNNLLITVSGTNELDIILPFMGQIDRSGGQSYANERCGRWTTTITGTQSYGANFYTNGGEINFLSHDRAGALPIRCIKE